MPRVVRVIAIIAVVLTSVAVFSAVKFGTFRVVPGTIKAMRRQMDANPESRIAHTGWNAYSRIDAVEGVAPRHVARLYIHSDAWTSIVECDGRLESAKDLRDSYRALPFRLTPNAETLVIGPGGGGVFVFRGSGGGGDWGGVGDAVVAYAGGRGGIADRGNCAGDRGGVDDRD